MAASVTSKYKPGDRVRSKYGDATVIPTPDDAPSNSTRPIVTIITDWSEEWNVWEDTVEPLSANAPRELSPEALRSIADWLDTYDKLAVRYFSLKEVQSQYSPNQIVAALAACAGKSIQNDLRNWAAQLQAQHEGEHLNGQ